MKIPSDKLPLKVHGIGKKQLYGQYTITRPIGYAGRITGKDLSQYVVKAANKFPEAIELLNKLSGILSELDGVTFTDDSEFQYSTYSDVKEQLEEYLNKLEDE